MQKCIQKSAKPYREPITAMMNKPYSIAWWNLTEKADYFCAYPYDFKMTAVVNHHDIADILLKIFIWRRASRLHIIALPSPHAKHLSPVSISM